MYAGHIGTCIDITPIVEAEQAQERAAARFRSLVEKSPDALMVLADDGQILVDKSQKYQWEKKQWIATEAFLKA